VRPAFANPIALPAGFNSVSYTTNNDGFTLKAAKGGIKFVVSGTFDGAENPTPSKVVIEQDGKTQTFDAPAKLPADLQSDVDTLLKTVELRK
jgi:hypothetical protein